MGDIGSLVSQKGYDVKTSADRLMLYSSAFSNLKIFSVSSVTGIIPPSNSANFTAATNDIITSAGHGLVNGDVVNFTTDGTLPGGLRQWPEEYYYVINKTVNTFQVSLTLGGSAVDITSTGSGTHTWYTDTNIIDVNHNLGYFAPAILVYNGSTSIGQTKSYFMSDSLYPIEFRITPNFFRIIIPALFDGGSTVAGDTVYFTLYQFLDTFDSYTAPEISSATTQGDEAVDYGIRVSKAGFDVKTCADIDCIFSSSFFTNIIHKKGIDSTGQVTHGLGYIPSYLSYIFQDYYLVSSTTSTSVTLTTLESAGTTYYVIFK